MKKPDRPEHRLSHWVDKMLERIIIEPCWMTAVDTGTVLYSKDKNSRFAWEEHRKYIGIRPGHLDWYVFGCDSRVYTQFELKYGDNKTRDGQDTTIRLLKERLIPTGVYNTVLGVYEHIKGAGIKLHGNAADMAFECEMRWRSADLLARGTVKVKKAYKPRAPKASPSKIRKVEKSRASGIRF